MNSVIGLETYQNWFISKKQVTTILKKNYLKQ